MPYTLTTCEGENNKQAIRNPSPAALIQAIDALRPARSCFVILETDSPINNCVYVQALVEYEGKFEGKHLVEARYLFADRFKHYRMHTGDAGEVKRIFQAFAEGIAPNTAGWDDITESMRPAAG